MQVPGGPAEDPTGGFKYGGWVAPLADDPIFDEELGTMFGEPFGLLLGRRTYDIGYTSCIGIYLSDNQPIPCSGIS